MKELKPNMLKTILISAMVILAGAAAPTANAQTCGYTPDELVRMTLNLKRYGDPNAARTVVESVFQNCDDYATIFNNFTNQYGG